jgi:hypothetical protein
MNLMHQIDCELLLLWFRELPHKYGMCFDSDTTYINTHPIRTLTCATSSLVGHRSYWVLIQTDIYGIVKYIFDFFITLIF